MEPTPAKPANTVDGPPPVTADSYQTIAPAPADQFATVERPISESHAALAFAHEPRLSGSRGLHIRCPHCNSGIELLSDTPYDSIKCGLCGSDFNLVEPDEHTRHAPALKTIGRFELVSRLGLGSFGTVWKARDTELDRTVALKIPRKGQLGNTEIEQFFREARSAAQLQHPNIVPVHEVGRDGETIFIVSDLIRGVSLADWLTAGTPSPQIIVRIMATVAAALDHAHQMGVIHRDLKPSNVLMDESGEPHVMDFGLAKREVGEVTMTRDGNILGTPAYMSPEQAGGQAHWTDRRSDIYSMGVMLFQMLTGEFPFRGNAQMQVHQRLTEDPPNPRTLNRSLPRDLCTICLKCLERDPNRRYSTAKELAEELGRFIRHEPILARPISRIERVLRWAKRKPALAAALALMVFLAIAGPLAAVHIARQRAQLEVRLNERNALIKTTVGEMSRANQTIDNFRKQLDVWEGRANPTEFWPPQPGNYPRRKVASDLFDRSNTALVNGLRSGNFGHEATARGYLGLAALAGAVGKATLAQEYYQRARDELLPLRVQNPQEPRIARALAECYIQLATLGADANRDQAASDFASARNIYKQLAVERKSDAVFQIDWLELELQSATLAGFDSGKEQLIRVDEIANALPGKWPTDPEEIYRLACYLTLKEPILSAPASKEMP